MNDKPVLILAEDPVLRGALGAALNVYDKAAALVAGDEAAALEMLPEQADIIVFALAAPESFLRKARKRAPGIKAVGVFSQPEASPDGMAGADCFPMPLRLGALLDRVRRHRAGMTVLADEADIEIGLYVLQLEKGRLVAQDGGSAVSLTEKECDILRALNAQRGRTVSRKTLLEKVWGYAEGIETHTLETHIYRVRQKIERDPSAPEFLLTDEAGYRLV